MRSYEINPLQIYPDETEGCLHLCLKLTHLWVIFQGFRALIFVKFHFIIEIVLMFFHNIIVHKYPTVAAWILNCTVQ